MINHRVKRDGKKEVYKRTSTKTKMLTLRSLKNLLESSFVPQKLSNPVV